MTAQHVAWGLLIVGCSLIAVAGAMVWLPLGLLAAGVSLVAVALTGIEVDRRP